MSEPRPNRMFIIGMTQDDAVTEIVSAGDNRETARAATKTITDLLLGANLTPLQAQAVLVRAWRNVQVYGRLTPNRQESQDHAPIRQETAIQPQE